MDKDYIDIHNVELSDMYNCPIVRKDGYARTIIAIFMGKEIGVPGLALSADLSDFEIYEESYYYIKKLTELLKD